MGKLRDALFPPALPPRREVRAPTAATQQVSWLSAGLPMVPNWDAPQAIQLAYYSNVFVYKCVQVVAQALSGLPFRVGADPTKPADYNPNAPLAKLLGPPPFGPNPSTSARQLWQNAVAQYLVTGRFAWEYETDPSGSVSYIWPLVSSVLRPIPSTGGSRYFDGFEYGTQRPKRLQPKQVLYHWRPSIEDWRQPESVLQAARLDVSVAVMQDRYDYAFLKNDSRPAVAVVHEAFATEEAKDAFRNQFRSEFGGPDQAGKPVFVQTSEGGAPVDQALKIESLGISQRDSMAIDRLKAKIRSISVAFGVPLSMLGDASDRTFANADQEEFNFWTVTMAPLIADFTDAINMQLAPLVGDDIGWFDVSAIKSLRRPSPILDPAMFSILPNLIQLGAIDIEEIRHEFGLESRVGIVPIPEVAPAPLTLASGQTSAPRFSEITTKSLEEIWTRTLREHVLDEERATLKRLEGRKANTRARSGDAGQLFDTEYWADKTHKVVENLFDSALAVVGIALESRFSPDAEFIETRISAVATELTDATRQVVEEELRMALENNESPTQIGVRLTRSFAALRATKCAEVAKTETMGICRQALHWQEKVIPIHRAGRIMRLVSDGRLAGDAVKDVLSEVSA